MWIVAIAWIYVALMMALAEATSPQGTYLGAVITFLFYGVAPTALVMYLLGTPARRRARLKSEAQAQAEPRGQAEQTGGQPEADSTQADAGRLATGAAIPPEGEEAGRS